MSALCWLMFISCDHEPDWAAWGALIYIFTDFKESDDVIKVKLTFPFFLILASYETTNTHEHRIPVVLHFSHKSMKVSPQMFLKLCNISSDSQICFQFYIEIFWTAVDMNACQSLEEEREQEQLKHSERFYFLWLKFNVTSFVFAYF